MLLAADTPSADFTLQALLLAGVVVQLLLGWVQLSGRREAQRRQVSFETEFATKGEMHELKQQIHAIDLDLRNLKQSIHDNGEARRVRIEGKIEGVRGELMEKLDPLAENVARLAAALSAINGRLSAWNENPPWKTRA